MTKSRYSQEQVAFALRQAEGGTPIVEVCREGWPVNRKRVYHLYRHVGLCVGRHKARRHRSAVTRPERKAAFSVRDLSRRVPRAGGGSAFRRLASACTARAFLRSDAISRTASVSVPSGSRCPPTPPPFRMATKGGDSPPHGLCGGVGESVAIGGSIVLLRRLPPNSSLKPTRHVRVNILARPTVSGRTCRAAKLAGR